MKREYMARLDENRNIKPGVIIRGSLIPDNTYYQLVHVVIFSSDGKILCQKRAGYEDEEVWDLSAGGMVQLMERSEDAMHRELLEELGLDREFSKEDCIFTNRTALFFDDYYFLTEDLDPASLKLQEEEVSAVEWKSVDEILELQANDKFTDYFDIKKLCEVYKRHLAAEK